MLTKFQRELASKIATQLVEDGMLWGEELEWYLKLGVIGLIEFKNDAHYFEFEDEVLDKVNKRRRYARLVDTTTDTEYKFNKAHEIAKHLGIMNQRVYEAIHSDSLISKRYKVEYVVIPVKDLGTCNKSIYI